MSRIPDVGRVLGVDPGDVRIGLAVSDGTQTVATALATVDVTGDLGPDAEAVGAAVAEHVEDGALAGIVVGLPRTLSGREAEPARRARRLASLLADRLGVPSDVWDERFSTTEAERVMISAGTRRRKRRQSIDRVAATIILQGWLDARRAGSR